MKSTLFILLLFGLLNVSFANNFDCISPSANNLNSKSCDSKSQFCMITENQMGYAATHECVDYPNKSCTSTDCLTEYAKAELFPNVENCKHSVYAENHDSKVNIRCVFFVSPIPLLY